MLGQDGFYLSVFNDLIDALTIEVPVSDPYSRVEEKPLFLYPMLM